MRSSRSLSILLFSIATLAWSSGAVAAGDMLKPSEVPTTGESSKPTNDSGGFVGTGFVLGQARATDGDAPGLATWLYVEPGAQLSGDSWNRLELSGQIFTGSMTFRGEDGKVTLTTPLGALAKFGYGYSLGGTMFGVAKVGIGPVLGKMKLDLNDDAGSYTSDTTTGLAAQLGWEMVIPVGKSLDLTAGASWSYLRFDIGKLKSSNNEPHNLDKSVLVTVLAADAGVRFRF